MSLEVMKVMRIKSVFLCLCEEEKALGPLERLVSRTLRTLSMVSFQTRVEIVISKVVHDFRRPFAYINYIVSAIALRKDFSTIIGFRMV